MIPPTKVSIEQFLLAEDGSVYKTFVLILHLIRDSPNISKSAIYFDFAQYSNFYFSATTSLISSTKISIENTAPVDEYSFRKSLIFFASVS